MPKVRRICETIEGGSKSYLEIDVHENGDIFVSIQGVDKNGNPSYSQISFCSQAGEVIILEQYNL